MGAKAGALLSQAFSKQPPRMVRASLANVLRILSPNPGGGISDAFFLESQQDADVLNLADYYVDMDVAGEGLLISYWTE